MNPHRLGMIKNFDFHSGVRLPTAWTWFDQGQGGAWQFVEQTAAGKPRRVLRLRSSGAECGFEQKVACAAGHHYRFEAVIQMHAPGAGPPAVFELSATPCGPAGPTARPICTHGDAAQRQRFTCRGYFETPPRTTHLLIRLTVSGGPAPIDVYEAQVVSTQELDQRAHPLAVPPPPSAYPMPREIHGVALCDPLQVMPFIRSLLEDEFAERCVRSISPAALMNDPLEADAVLLDCGSQPPPDLTLKRLETLARRRVMVVALETFAALVNRQRAGTARIRLVRQENDPFHARVTHANFMTVGFALDDCFPYGYDLAEGVSAQAHLSKTAALRSWCAEHDYEIVLTSETQRTSTSGQPVCVFKQFEQGALVATDFRPVRSRLETGYPSRPARLLLLNALGIRRPSVAQFQLPAPQYSAVIKDVKEFAHRFEGLRLLSIASGGDRSPLWGIEVGGPPMMYGLPAADRPLILLRTGLTGSDWPGFYAVMLWLKRLLRPAPYNSGRIGRLLTSRRVIWIPIWAPRLWGTSKRTVLPERGEPYLELQSALETLQPGGLATVIDVTDGSCSEPKVSRLTPPDWPQAPGVSKDGSSRRPLSLRRPPRDAPGFCDGSNGESTGRPSRDGSSATGDAVWLRVVIPYADWNCAETIPLMESAVPFVDDWVGKYAGVAAEFPIESDHRATAAEALPTGSGFVSQ